jgi:hypothetical protein
MPLHFVYSWYSLWQQKRPRCIRFPLSRTGSVDFRSYLQLCVLYSALYGHTEEKRLFTSPA